MNRITRGVAAAATAAAALLSSTAVADATPQQDQAFIDTLTAADISPGPAASGWRTLIQAAWVICGQVWSGTDPQLLANAAYEGNSGNGLTQDNAELVVAAAIGIYCPPDPSAVMA